MWSREKGDDVAAVLDGVKVIEVAGWTFVPSGGAVLADWGADVIKVEHPETGDPQRGLSVGTVGAKGAGGVSFVVEQPNRSKRSVGLNIGAADGRKLLLALVAKADVFLTNLLPERLRRLRLTVEDLRAANPRIIIARGTGQGVRGEDADKAGFDGSSYFARGGENTYDLVANPVQFDETPPELTRAPDSGEHTDEILEKDLGLDWDRIIQLKADNTVN
jgi:crotonobetainyl-CoA:carnitine CoA-transferase CaiB-like acyl-CoA transferase